jgi:hypothetical protein
MKKISILVLYLALAVFAHAADTTLQMANTKIDLVGNKVSTIKTVNYAGKVIGNLFTYTSITSTAIVFSHFQQYKNEGTDFVSIQTITPTSTIGLIPDISLKKSFANPEMKTNPKQYWEVSIAFKQKNGNYIDVGATKEYRLSYNDNYSTKKVEIENYTGTNRLIPFATKQAAENFITSIKEIIKK